MKGANTMLILGILIGLIVGVVFGLVLSFPLGSAFGMVIDRFFSNWAVGIEFFLVTLSALIIFKIMNKLKES